MSQHQRIDRTAAAQPEDSYSYSWQLSVPSLMRGPNTLGAHHWCYPLSQALKVTLAGHTLGLQPDT
jgi:hypothetical protein